MKTFFTDGSCYPNPLGPGGWAFVRVDENEIYIEWGYIESTTSNRAEMTAVIKAMDNCNIMDVANVITDSEYTANICKGRRNGDEYSHLISNRDLIKIIHNRLRANSYIEVDWEPGHSDNIYNELSHEYCNSARIDESSDSITFDVGKVNEVYRQVKSKVARLKKNAKSIKMPKAQPQINREKTKDKIVNKWRANKVFDNTIMWFGKYKGVKLKDVPDEYFKYLIDNKISFKGIKDYSKSRLSVSS